MRRRTQNIVIGLLVAVGVIAGAIWFAPGPRILPSNLPAQIDDQTFWQLVTDLSEPGGSFRSDNFVSNERQFQWVLAELEKGRSPGGVYLGVGPDQNFTYLVALKPKIAFIIDIRRQNMLEHLMYKALLDLSSDRVDFLSRLFSRPKPEGLDPDDTAGTLLQAFTNSTPNKDLFNQNFKSILDNLTVTHRVQLTGDDVKSIEYIYTAFFDGGPNLTYTFNSGPGAPRGFGNRGMPTYAELMNETDEEGHNRSYLATSQNFQTLQDLEKRNVLIPIVGDFAGGKAVRAVGKYVRDHGATVTAFYTSNVEQYLFQQGDDWNRFYDNVATLPLDSGSTFIRSIAIGRRMQTISGRASLLCPIQELLDQIKAGRISSYNQVIRYSH